MWGNSDVNIRVVSELRTWKSITRRMLKTRLCKVRMHWQTECTEQNCDRERRPAPISDDHVPQMFDDNKLIISRRLEMLLSDTENEVIDSYFAAKSSPEFSCSAAVSHNLSVTRPSFSIWAVSSIMTALTTFDGQKWECQCYLGALRST